MLPLKVPNEAMSLDRFERPDRVCRLTVDGMDPDRFRSPSVNYDKRPFYTYIAD